MTKHFPGGGPQQEGLDPHFEFHKGQIYPGSYFDYHLIPFEAAFAAQTAAIMPYYGVPLDQTDENVAMSFNKAIITGLLRERYGYEGVVCTDWGLITDTHLPGAIWPARAWGVEQLGRVERVGKALEAGVDQFGGESCPELVVELVKAGRVSEARLDRSIRRLLRLKFQLGLFDNPFVDEAHVAQVFGHPASARAGAASQTRAMTLLKNADQVLPLRGRPKLYVQGMDPTTAAGYAEVVSTPEEADFALARVATPWYPVDTPNFVARGFHHGDLDFKGDAKASMLALMQKLPTIVVLYWTAPRSSPRSAAWPRRCWPRVRGQRHGGVGCDLWQGQPGRQVAV